jgi:transcriptional regulator with XRE-family HTH domain
MNDSNRELLFNAALCERVSNLRRERGWTAEQMATALGVPSDRYRKYEKRSPLPAYLMESFCLIVDCDLDYLLTGRKRVMVAARQSEVQRRA